MCKMFDDIRNRYTANDRNEMPQNEQAKRKGQVYIKIYIT